LSTCVRFSVDEYNMAFLAVAKITSRDNGKPFVEDIDMQESDPDVGAAADGGDDCRLGLQQAQTNI
jgi:hypothetical protein